MTIKIDEKTKQAIESVLAKDQRVELIPNREAGTVKVLLVKREKIEVDGSQAQR